MQKQRTILLLLVSIIWLNLHSQSTPYLAANSKALNAIEKLQLPLQNNELLLEEEMARRGPGIAPRFAQKMAVDVSPATHGTWSYRNGKAVWHLRVPSPGARSLNFGFDLYEMPPGGELLLFDPAQKEVLGPFTPADNEEHAELWTPVIPGDDIILEVRVPVDQQENLKLHLKSVNHDFLGFLDVAESLVSGSCNLDVACGGSDGWGIVDQYRDIIQSVAAYGFSGDIFCTGFLVNTVREDCTAYFMTADHCGLTAGAAPSMVFYWNFENSTCRQPGSAASGGPGNGTLGSFNTGSVLRATYAPSDFTLVELDDPVVASADAFYAGWDAREVLETDTLIAIHHPNNEEKRISFAFSGVYRGAWGQADTPIPNGNHVIVEDWDIGTTEGGSSGSPLFDSRKRVIGQLHGGAAACGNDFYDSYGWMASSWEGGGTPSTRLKDWLDPDNTGIRVIDGRNNEQCNFFATASPPAQTLCAPETATFNVQVSSAFSSSVSLSVEGLPGSLSVSFDNTVVSPGSSTQLTIGNTASATPDDYVFRLVGTDGTTEVDQLLRLTIYGDAPNGPALSSPPNLATEQPTILTLDWADEASVIDYTIQLATDPGFSSIAFSDSGLAESTIDVSGLAPDTEFYWRVRGQNACGEGDWSSVFQFVTASDFCGLGTADTDGLSIGPNAGAVTTSTLNVTQQGIIEEIKVICFNTNHSYSGDLTATLTSPSGITIQLFNQSNCPGAGVLADFADDASLSPNDFEQGCTIGSQAAIEGAFRPAEPLGTFIGEDAAGTWTLRVTDNANFDGGNLLGWKLEVCTDAINSTVDLGGTSLEIWPNPTNGPLQISFSEELNGDVDVAIYNVDGRFIRQARLQSAVKTAEVDLSDLASGVYLLRLQHESTTKTVRIVRH
ncbi:MAG: T9SS type A sorting domain-containing protein [Bacteroidota bacterium]